MKWYEVFADVLWKGLGVVAVIFWICIFCYLGGVCD